MAQDRVSDGGSNKAKDSEGMNLAFTERETRDEADSGGRRGEQQEFGFRLQSFRCLSDKYPRGNGT